MYKIMIKYKSVQNKVYWFEHQETLFDGEIVNFETDSLDELKREIKSLSKKIGIENIKIISEIQYSSVIDVEELQNSNNYEYMTSNDVINMFNNAYDNIFTSE